MKHEDKGCLVFLVVIAGRNQKEALLSALFESGMHLMSTIYGRGTVKASYLMNAFGLTPEERKIMITCVATRDVADIALNMLVEKFKFNEPNTGIAYTTQIEKVSY